MIERYSCTVMYDRDEDEDDEGAKKSFKLD